MISNYGTAFLGNFIPAFQGEVHIVLVVFIFFKLVEHCR